MNQEILLYCISKECQIEKKLCNNLESVYLHSKDNHKLVKFSDLNQIIDNEYAIIPQIKNQINDTNQQVQHIKQLIDQTSAEIQQRYLQTIKELDKENQFHVKLNSDKISQVQQNQISQNIEREVLQKSLQTQTQKLFQNFKESINSFKKEILEELNIYLRKLVDQKGNQVQFVETPTKFLDDSVQQQQLNQQTPVNYLQDGQQIDQSINQQQQNDAQVQQRVLEQEKVQLTRKIFVFNQTLSDNHMKKSDKMITAKDQSLAFIHEDFNLSKRETYALKLKLRELDSKVQTLIRVGVIKSVDFKRKSFKTVLIGQYGAENGVLIQSDKQTKSDDIIFKGDSTIKMKIASASHMLKLKIDGKSFNIELDYKEDFSYRFFVFVQNLEVVLKN